MKIRMKKDKEFIKFFIPLGIICVIMITVLISCADEVQKESVDKSKTKQQEESFKEMYKKIKGAPEITNWQEAKQLKQIYEARDDAKLTCYAYTRNEYTGKYVYEGRCRGFGIPYSTQFSNPEKVIEPENELGYNLYVEENGALMKPQPEPNGMFMPTSSDSTWLMMIDDKGNEEIQYWEPKIVVTQSKKHRRYCEPWSLPKWY